MSLIIDVLLDALSSHQPRRYDASTAVFRHAEEQAAVLVVRHLNDAMELATYAFGRVPSRHPGPALWSESQLFHAGDPDLLTKIAEDVQAWKTSPIDWTSFTVCVIATRFELDLTAYIVSAGGSTD